jgi:copper chaperone CopZ
MITKTFHIPNISCGHCVRSIKDELEEIIGVSRWMATLKKSDNSGI